MTGEAGVSSGAVVGCFDQLGKDGGDGRGGGNRKGVVNQPRFDAWRD